MPNSQRLQSRGSFQSVASARSSRSEPPFSQTNAFNLLIEESRYSQARSQTMSGGRRYRQGNAVRNSVETLATSSTQSQEERRSIDPADKDSICTNRSPHGMPARDRFESLNTGQQSLPHVSQDGHTTAGGAFIAPIYDTWNGANKVTFADSHLFVASLTHDGTRTDHESTPMDTSSSFSHSSLSSRRRAWPSADPVCSQHSTETRDRKTWLSFKLHWPTDIPGYNGRRGGHSLPRGEGIGQRRSLVQ